MDLFIDLAATFCAGGAVVGGIMWLLMRSKRDARGRFTK